MRNRLSLLVFVLLFLSTNCFSQSFDVSVKYPYEAIDKKIEGKIFVQFVIDRTGKILDDSVKVLKGLGYGLDELAVNAIKSAPDWEPMNEQMIKTTGGYKRFAVPIAFSLTALTNKDWSEYFTTKGDKLREESDLEAALENYQNAISQDKKNAKAYYGMSKVYEAKGETVKAKDYLDTAIKRGYKK